MPVGDRSCRLFSSLPSDGEMLPETGSADGNLRGKSAAELSARIELLPKKQHSNICSIENACKSGSFKCIIGKA